MYRLGLVDTLVTHANMKGLGLTPLFGDRRGFIPPQLKTKNTMRINCSSSLKMFPNSLPSALNLKSRTISENFKNERE